MRRAVLFFFTILTICSCAGHPQARTALFVYEDFGPPAMASELLGMDWWQWQAHGDSRPAKYAVKVVVYRNVGLDEVKKQYPVVPEQDKDYRYVEYAQAIRYLDSNIKENAIESLTTRLKASKAKIVQQLGPP